LRKVAKAGLTDVPPLAAIALAERTNYAASEFEIQDLGS